MPKKESLTFPKGALVNFWVKKQNLIVFQSAKYTVMMMEICVYNWIKWRYIRSLKSIY